MSKIFPQQQSENKWMEKSGFFSRSGREEKGISLGRAREAKDNAVLIAAYRQCCLAALAYGNARMSSSHGFQKNYHALVGI